MEAAFWRTKWKDNVIGFHQAEFNAHLTRWWPTLSLSPGARVLVPLCGKTRDMLWLRQRGHAVVGVELSEIACQAFFEENGVPYQREPVGSHVRWRATDDGPALELLQGDFLALDASKLGRVDALFDRAAFIALPEPMRRRYAKQLAALLPPAARGLLIHIWYPQHEKKGPPFSVTPSHASDLLAEDFELQTCAQQDLMQDLVMSKRWPLSSLDQAIVALTRRQGSA